tara:strand:+ start:790 stop:1869 length:1080 start_codon:yes stop_codon:yes gene_type:complete
LKKLKRKYLINNFIFLFLLLIFLSITSMCKSDDIKKLRDLYNLGLITEDELKKAISIAQKQSSSNISSSRIKIEKLFDDASGTKFEKLQFYIDNYRIYTLRPGLVVAVNMLTGENDVVLKDNFKVELNADGKKYFEFLYDKENLESQLNYKGQMLINWTGKYVSKHNATFYQMQVLGYMPFHFFIRLNSIKKTVALNVDHFSSKINKAVKKAKEEIAIKYNLSVSDIDKILEKKQNKLDQEVEKVISEEQQRLIKELTEKYAGQAINDEIKAEIEKTVGEEIANALISAIEDASGMAINAAIEREVANEVDAAISRAVEMGVSQAAAAAAIEAMIWVYAMGGTDAQALEACQYYAGDAC